MFVIFITTCKGYDGFSTLKVDMQMGFLIFDF